MTNDQLTRDQHRRWHDARRRVDAIRSHLRAGGRVVIGTHTKATVYTARHADLFAATRGGAFVRRGKGWDCIDYCGVRFL